MQYRLILIPLILFVQTALLTGCASNDKPAYSNIAIDENAVGDRSPQEVVEHTAAIFDRAENHDLDFYSPKYYSESRKALDTARSSLKQQKHNEALRAAIASRNLLERAQQVRSQVDRNLKDLIKHRNLLIELDAEQWKPSQWNSVSNEINDLVQLIENDKVQSALQQEPRVREDMYELEINVLLASTLKPARDMLAKAEEHEARTYSYKYFNQADILIDDTEIYIRSNYRDRKGIAERAESTRLVAMRAYKTALDAQKLVALDADEYEAYLSSIYSLIEAIAQEFEEEPRPPATVAEALKRLHTLSKNYNISKIKLEEPAPEPLQADPVDSPQIQVLEVLDTLQLESKPIDNELEQDEQGFDEVEIVE